MNQLASCRLQDLRKRSHMMMRMEQSQGNVKLDVVVNMRTSSSSSRDGDPAFLQSRATQRKDYSDNFEDDSMQVLRGCYQCCRRCRGHELMVGRCHGAMVPWP